MRVFVFCWNTASIALSSALDSYSGISPDFFLPLMKEIELEDPDVVIFGFQEDRYPGSYFHSHLLRAELPKYGYKYVESSTMMGVGVTTYKNLFYLDLMVRGLATSVYVRERFYATSRVNWYYTSSSRGKGGLAIHLTVGSYKLTVANVHLPFNAASLIEAREVGDPMIRQNEVNRTNIYFNDITRNLMEESPAIFMGDFNYRNSDPRSATTVIKDIIANKMTLDHDELRQQMTRGNVYPFFEGVDDKGPTFPPTCKLVKKRENVVALNGKDIPDNPEVPIERKDRGDTYYNIGKMNQRVPSHPDRILYTNRITCSRYDSFDVGEAVKGSDHAPIFGVFRLTS